MCVRTLTAEEYSGIKRAVMDALRTEVMQMAIEKGGPGDPIAARDAAQDARAALRSILHKVAKAIA
jgi:hypothetical protein